MLSLTPDTQIAHRVLILSACYQVTDIIHNIATSGTAMLEPFQHLLEALFIESSDACLDSLKTHSASFQTGTEQLITQLEARQKPSTLANMEATRYILSLMALEKNVSKSGVLNPVAQAVSECNQKRTPERLDQTIAHLADIYKEYISPMKPRILVKGSENHLKEGNNAERVRSSLLIAIRLIILWRQFGGRRWHLFLYRKRYIEQAKLILNA